MSRFELISTAVDVTELRAQLAGHPELWNRRPERRGGTSPHRETDDIWVRFRSPDDLAGYGATPHFSVFWPAWHALPAVRGIVFPIMAALEAVYLGGILITRIPAGCQVYPHDDRGSWHAEYLNAKVYVPIQAPPECVNWCENEAVVMNAGEAWRFDNLLPHRVVNASKTEDRMTLIICMRVE